MHGHAGQLDFVGSTNTIYICLILSTIYIFISVSGCVGMEPSALSGVYCAVKTALYITPSLFVRVVPASNKKTTSMLSTLSLQYCYFKCVLSLSGFCFNAVYLLFPLIFTLYIQIQIQKLLSFFQQNQIYLYTSPERDSKSQRQW